MRKIFALSVLATFAFPVAVRADDAAAVKKAVEANHVAAMKAFEKKNVKGMVAFLTDDYVSISPMGKQDKKATTAMMEGYAKSTKKIHSSSYTASGIKVKGDTATGKAKFTLDCDLVDDQGMMGKKGAPHRMQMEENHEVTWKKVGGKWLTQIEKTIGNGKMVVDGKTFGPQPVSASTSAKIKK